MNNLAFLVGTLVAPAAASVSFCGRTWQDTDTEIDLFKINCAATGANTIPALSSMTGLVTLSVQRDQLTGTIPDVSANTALVTLNLSHNNQITGSIPDLSANTALVTLKLNKLNLAGSTIPSLSANTNLVTIDLSQTKIGGSIPSLNNNVLLQNVLLGWNTLTGTIPDLSANTALKQFHIKQNDIQDTMPDFSGFSDLEVLHLAENGLRGTIGDLSQTSLQVLALEQNHLSGPIPSLPTSVQTVRLSKNLLTGTVPGYSGYGSLKTLALNYNLLNGVIPDYGTTNSGLTGLFLAGNIWKCDQSGTIYDYSAIQAKDKFGNWFTNNDHTSNGCVAYCVADGVWQETPPGRTALAACDNETVGRMGRECLSGGIWSNDIDRSECIDQTCTQLEAYNQNTLVSTPTVADAGECEDECRGDLMCHGFTFSSPDCELYSSTKTKVFSVSKVSDVHHCENWPGEVFANQPSINVIIDQVVTLGPTDDASACCQHCLDINECNAWNFDTADKECTPFIYADEADLAAVSNKAAGIPVRT